MKKILFNMILLTSLCACSSFLEPNSPSEYVPESVDALNEMLLGDAYPLATSSCLFNLHNAFDDDIEMSEDFILQTSSYGIIGLQYIYSWDPQMFDLYPGQSAVLQWSTYYQHILGTNAALDYLDDVKGSIEDKAYVAAQAYALRAFFYFNLVNLFGEPYNYNKDADGVPLKLTSSLSSSSEKRETVAKVYEQIVKDLNAAEENFLALSADRQGKVGYRINLPAVQLLHARVCLYMEDMEGAAKYAKKVIDNWGYELYDLTSFKKDTTIVVGKNASYPSYVSLDNPETIWVYGNAADFNGIIGAQDKMENGTTYAYFVNASRDLITCYEDEEDLRKTLYLVEELRGPLGAKPEELKFAEGHYLPWSKCVMQYNNKVKSGTEYGMSFRLSEAYLILAEAVYATDEVLALKMINELREKRYAEGADYEVHYSGESLLNFIREERRRELCFEGQRWFDLRRYGMPSFEHRWVEYGDNLGSYVIEEKDAAYTLPIPTEVINRNSALNQNKLTTTKTLQ
ncbi:RagB/SusD family nutrient uptake outer membrane protein [Odoribacter sp. AF15-53]|uniref:RagB/SusD family nutrient uptake outer membrane protein n=1 Tax=Odoribacter sp. AF15-53 TaxID=2292236 RepID=UPI000E4AFFD6|nr:RagB/SusD family nutrient uptake outer membrane protein [Odoribacter sp. AF15-53]RHR79719.1 RagB/SusD family nutrient uptake outer membrane protein [Odoribacter sp. AF15-53]